MLISPVRRDPTTARRILGAFGFGLILGGTLTAGVLWLLSALTPDLPAVIGAALLAAGGALITMRDLKLVSFPLPQNARQVPRSVFDRGPRSAALRFGFELGTGVRTFISAGAPYVVALTLILYGQRLPSAIAAGVGFGIGRFAMAFSRHVSASDDQWDRALEKSLRPLLPLLTGATACLAVYLALTVG